MCSMPSILALEKATTSREWPVTPMHDRARGCRRRHIDIATPAARALGFVFALARAERLAGRPDARAANTADLGSFLLRQAPRTILLSLDLHAGRDAEVQVDLAQKDS